MNLKQLKPRKALNKAYLKLKPDRKKIDIFKTNLIQLLDRIDDSESEEFHKNLISDFLKDTYYKDDHFINTKERADLVIHNGKNRASTVGVIIETKRPTNKWEMITPEEINAKAFHELLLYYLRERITNGNLEVRNLIVTNIHEWYIFDSAVFERNFAQNKALIRQFEAFEKSKQRTEVFYSEIAHPFIESLTSEIEFTYFDIRDYNQPLRNDNPADDNILIALYKLLSAEHLLKLPFANDSNTLDKSFYGELLHIMGLSESKEGGKKVIGREQDGNRNIGSLIENAINELDSLDKMSRLDNPSQYGQNMQERLFSVALELTITWMNRILFMKLLEAQLIKYHKGDMQYEYLNIGKIQNYDDLNGLFFKVLARKLSDRGETTKEAFQKVPYLNSSLFEPTELEHLTLFVSNLGDSRELPIYSATVLKDDKGKRRTGKMNPLEYLFEFLDSYDFTSEGSEAIQEDNKTLINASVLGLIFEKINGYKDGSFFTPGFITMYMCRETIRKAVLQKFNEAKQWNCKDTNELYNKIDDIDEANAIVNSLKICDPAVGSGHFLVSALNEIIAIKNDLRILRDREGRRLKEYHVVVENDELIVTDDDGAIFEYNPTSHESQRVQETLFHEKQTIIENCLFGVDINPNSVKICRLRLWIELLKNAYYIKRNSVKLSSPVCFAESDEVRNDFKLPHVDELQTLPNIDINIKCGNSLVSRFDLDADLGQALKKSKWTIDSYRVAVATYRNAHSKEEKREMERLMVSIKNDFRSEIAGNDPKVKRLTKIKGELLFLTTQTSLFEQSRKEKKEWNDKVDKLTGEIKKLDTEIGEIKANKIYENAFEWRFEFPEVLNDEGDFVGFDVVIGNPPYGLFNKKQNQKIALTTDKLAVKYLKDKYPEATGGVINAARIFFAFSFTISSNIGFQNMIIPYGILTDTTSVNLRKHIFTNHSLYKVDAFPERDSASRRVFEDVKMSTAILLTSNKKVDMPFDIGISYDRSISTNRSVFKSSDLIKLSPELIQIPLTDTKSFNLLLKIYETNNVVSLSNISPCNTGELDMTFGKSALSNNPAHRLLVKGVQIDRFTLKTKTEDISQGEIEYVDMDKLSSIISDKKLADSSKRRIALQGLTGVNESRRLKGTIINENVFLANSSNYINEPSNCRLELILAWFNSKLLNFVFKARSTSSNVNGYEVDNLPFRFSKYDNELIRLSILILDMKKIDMNADTTALESEIDQLVYELYGLTEEEIGIVEGSVKG